MAILYNTAHTNDVLDHLLVFQLSWHRLEMRAHLCEVRVFLRSKKMGVVFYLVLTLITKGR